MYLSPDNLTNPTLDDGVIRTLEAMGKGLQQYDLLLYCTVINGETAVRLLANQLKDDLQRDYSSLAV